MPMSSNRWRSVYESFVIFFVNGGIFYTFFGGLVLLVIAARATKTDLVLGISFGRIELIWFFALVAMLVIGRFLGWGNIAESKRLESKLKPIKRGSVPKSSNRWRSAYESFAIVFVNGGGFYIFFGGLVLLVIAASATKAHSVLGISFGRIGGIWFFGFVGLVVLGSILGWEELAEHKRLEGKLKPIPARLGVSATELRPIDWVGSIQVPKLFIAGSVDQYTTLAESTQMFDAACQPKALWVVNGAGHEDAYRVAPGQYEQRVLGFFSQYLKHDSEQNTTKPPA